MLPYSYQITQYGAIALPDTPVRRTKCPQRTPLNIADRKRPERQYDAEMIRDFVDHLLTELWIEHDETILGPESVGTELREKATKYRTQYSCPGLLPTALVEQGECSEDQFHLARGIFRRKAPSPSGFAEPTSGRHPGSCEGGVAPGCGG